MTPLHPRLTMSCLALLLLSGAQLRAEEPPPASTLCSDQAPQRPEGRHKVSDKAIFEAR